MIVFIHNFFNENCRIRIICIGTGGIYMPRAQYFFGTRLFVKVKCMFFSMFAYIHSSSNIIFLFSNSVFNYTNPLLLPQLLINWSHIDQFSNTFSVNRFAESLLALEFIL